MAGNPYHQVVAYRQGNKNGRLGEEPHIIIAGKTVCPIEAQGQEQQRPEVEENFLDILFSPCTKGAEVSFRKRPGTWGMNPSPKPPSQPAKGLGRRA